MYVFQLHMSWPLFAPFVLVAFLRRESGLSLKYMLLGAITGAMLPALLLWPTMRSYGLTALWATGTSNAGIHLGALSSVPEILLRLLSLGSYECLGFNLGATIEARKAFLVSQPWLGVGAAFLLMGLVIQIAAFSVTLIRSMRSRGAWTPEYTWLLLTVLWICVLFLFTPRPPALRNFYVMFPVVIVAFARFFADCNYRQRVRGGISLLIVTSLAFHSLVGHRLLPEISIYQKRPLITKALEVGNYRLLGERRPGAIY